MTEHVSIKRCGRDKEVRQTSRSKAAASQNPPRPRQTGAPRLTGRADAAPGAVKGPHGGRISGRPPAEVMMVVVG